MEREKVSTYEKRASRMLTFHRQRVSRLSFDFHDINTRRSRLQGFKTFIDIYTSCSSFRFRFLLSQKALILFSGVHRTLAMNRL